MKSKRLHPSATLRSSTIIFHPSFLRRSRQRHQFARSLARSSTYSSGSFVGARLHPPLASVHDRPTFSPLSRRPSSFFSPIPVNSFHPLPLRASPDLFATSNRPPFSNRAQTRFFALSLPLLAFLLVFHPVYRSSYPSSLLHHSRLSCYVSSFVPTLAGVRFYSPLTSRAALLRSSRNLSAPVSLRNP